MLVDMNASMPRRSKPLPCLFVCVSLIVPGAFASVATAAEKPRLPKGVVAVRRDDGGYDVTAKLAAAPPGDGQVVRLDGRGQLEAAAMRLCPHGHALETDNAAGLSIDAAGRFVTVARGIVRCHPKADAAPPRSVEPATAGSDNSPP